MFIPLSYGATDTFQYGYIQAADPTAMQAQFTAFMTALIAINTVRVAQQLTPFNVTSVDISGGGDGHTFVMRFLLTVTEASGVIGWPQWVAEDLVNVRARFWIGADAPALTTNAPLALATLFDADNEEIANVAEGMAGATQGTRFMAFFAGVVTTEEV